MTDQTPGAGSDRFVDLTRPIESGMPVYPGDPPVIVEPHATHGDDGYRVSRLGLGSHTGTHVDAPAHVDPAGATLDSFGPGDLRFTARVVDCRDVGAGEAIAPSVVDGLRGTGSRTDLDALVFRTGWADEWGTDRMLEHPFLAAETARLCADAGVAVATDALSPDPSDRETDHPAHRALLGAGLPIVENVCNLDALPDGSFELLAFPLRIDADGAPARVVARV
ncbi:cyclase family protein [Halobellus captivus]|uniref:cyclase family protein n=1 Tax=Halobellus captivus TaxID=2592614 RepID=UPI0023AE8AF8|nr:cyclase family protein [Halobellus captivus]